MCLPSATLPRVRRASRRAFLAASAAATFALLAKPASAKQDRIFADDPALDALLLPPGYEPPRNEIVEYVVEAGDTVREIASKFQIDNATIVAANPAIAARPDALAVGTKLVILPTRGVLVTVQPGDTLADLASRFSLDPRLVADFNGIQDPSRLAVGQQLVLPGADPEELLTQQVATLPTSRAIRGFQPRWPAAGEITTYFGEVDYTSPRGHAGLDIAAGWGDPILAADGGRVLQAGWSSGYGNLAVVSHVDGFETWYGHLSSIAVKPGDEVERGERIGRMGNTGYSFGTHLHFEVREGGALRNPLRFLP